MLRVIRNHRRAPWRDRGLRGLAVKPVPLDHEAAPMPRLIDLAKAAWDEALSSASARLPQRAGHRDRAHRHDRAGDGLRHHRDRARFRAGEVQEAGRRRLFQDHQPVGARRPRQAGLWPAQIEEIIVPTPWATAPSATRRASTTPRWSGTASARRSWRGRKGAGLGLRHPLRVQPVDARRGVLHAGAGHPGRQAERSDLRSAGASGLFPARDRRGQRPCLRHHDAGRRAASRKKSITTSSTAPTPAARPASAISASTATST